MPITLTPAQITAAVAEDAARGILPKLIQQHINSGEMFTDLNDTPVLVTKFTDSDGKFEDGKLRSQVAAALKNAKLKVLAEGGNFPNLEATRVTEDGEVHVLIVDMDILAAAEVSQNGDGEL